MVAYGEQSGRGVNRNASTGRAGWTMEPLIPKHGGYRKLKGFQMAQLVYDLTVQFCDAHIDRRSRAHDQMVQAARSGVQNIAEGSQASGTSKKMELKLTNMARASLEELRLDYEDFLRQRGRELWPPEHPALLRFKARRCATVEQVRSWLGEELELAGKDLNTQEAEHRRTRTDTDNPRTQTDTDRRTNDETAARPGPNQGKHNQNMKPPSVSVGVGPCRTFPSAQLEANAALSLLNLCCYLLDRQLAAQAEAFEQDGGFTERLYGRRQGRRRGE